MARAFWTSAASGAACAPADDATRTAGRIRANSSLKRVITTPETPPPPRMAAVGKPESYHSRRPENGPENRNRRPSNKHDLADAPGTRHPRVPGRAGLRRLSDGAIRDRGADRSDGGR